MLCLIAAIVLALFGVVFLILACVETADPAPWSEKWQSMLESVIAGIPLLLAAAKMGTLAHHYRHNSVRLSASEVIFHTLDGKQFQIPYSAIQSVVWDPAPRKRVLTIKTAETTYTFDENACPRPADIAKLLEDRNSAPTPPSSK